MLSLRRLAVLALLLAQACAAPEARRPNFVFILIDDLGWQGVGYHGGPIATPNIDRLAAEGAKLEAFYAQPACTPTRAALMTGRYPMRYGLQVGVIRPWSDFGLPLDERTLAQALAAAGYETAIVGKWHLGHHERAYLPTQRGFAHQYGSYNGSVDYFTHERDGGLDWHRDDRASREPGYATELLGNEAVRLIEQHDFAQPLFLYLPFTAAHTPLQAPPELVARYAGIADPSERVYAAMVHAVDEQIARVVAAIEQRGETRDTLFVVASDNGAPVYLKGMNGGLRGGKYGLSEGGVRVVALAKWTGRIAPGTVVEEPLHMVDWFPTLLGLAGAASASPAGAGSDVPAGAASDVLHPLDGRDAWPTIANGAPSPHDAILLNTAPRGGALRSGRFKLVVTRRSRAPGGGPRAELFDVAQDPAEQVDVAAEHPETLKALRARYDAFARAAAPRKTSPTPEHFASPAVWGESE